MEFSLVVTIFISLSFVLLLSNAIKKHRNRKKLPPGPWKLPLIGNLHQLTGKFPHRTLRDMAKKYGPLMYLQFGEVPVVVVSSPNIAKKILKTHDLVFSGRSQTITLMTILYDCEDVVFHPYDEYWRQMRKICVMELLSAKKVKSFGAIRLEEGDRLVASVGSSVGESMNLSKEIRLYTSSVLCRAAFGKAYKDQETFLEVIKVGSRISAGFNLADMFPSSKLVLFLSGLMPKLVKIRNEIDDYVEDVIKQHVENSGTENRGNGEPAVEEDLIEILLRIKETSSLNLPVTIKHIKAIIVDIFSAGNETSSTTTSWAMTEMMRNPQVMEKAQSEIREAFKGKESIDEAKLPGLDYLNLVIKETLRLHPPTPLNIPRESMEDSIIDGYHIPNKTKVIVNSWALGRDPEYWHDPDKFIPERFQNNNLDFLGNCFEFIPFGSGRRICPGLAFGVANIQLPLALLLYHFDWNLSGSMKPEDLDVTEHFGVTCPPLNDLWLIPTLRPTIAHSLVYSLRVRNKTQVTNGNVF